MVTIQLDGDKPFGWLWFNGEQRAYIPSGMITLRYIPSSRVSEVCAHFADINCYRPHTRLISSFGFSVLDSYVKDAVATFRKALRVLHMLHIPECTEHFTAFPAAFTPSACLDPAEEHGFSIVRYVLVTISPQTLWRGHWIPYCIVYSVTETAFSPTVLDRLANFVAGKAGTQPVRTRVVRCNTEGSGSICDKTPGSHAGAIIERAPIKSSQVCRPPLFSASTPTFGKGYENRSCWTRYKNKINMEFSSSDSSFKGALVTQHYLNVSLLSKANLSAAFDGYCWVQYTTLSEIYNSSFINWANVLFLMIWPSISLRSTVLRGVDQRSSLFYPLS